MIQPFSDYLNTVFVSIWQDMINPALKDIGENIIPPLTEALDKLWKNVIKPLADVVGGILSVAFSFFAGILKDLWLNIVVPFAQGLFGEFSSAIQLVIGLIDTASILLKPLAEAINAIWNASLKPLAEWISSTFSDILNTFFMLVDGVISGITLFFKGLLDFLAGAFTADWEKTWNGLGEIIEGVFRVVGSFIEGFVNFFIDAINGIVGGLDWLTSGIQELTGKTIKVKKIEKFEMKAFANGGFPQQGSLFVAGETYGQSEWLGNINGKTGVTSGNEITGIADAIYITSNQEMELLRQQNQYLLGILNKEFGITRNQIGREAQAYAKEYQARTGNYAYQA